MNTNTNTNVTTYTTKGELYIIEDQVLVKVILILKLIPILQTNTGPNPNTDVGELFVIGNQVLAKLDQSNHLYNH